MEEDQQFCLRWNNHQSTLISVFDTLLENGTLVDCTLAAEGKFLKAHKVVLSACSPYFATLLSEQYDKHPIFILKDVKYQELRAMMDYMYRGEVNISQDQLAALLKAAESLQIKGLSDNRGGSGQKQSGEQQQKHSGHVPGKMTNIGHIGGGGYTLEQSKRARVGPSSIDSQDMCGSREGSSSPTSRKRRKIRRRSVDNVMGDNHENSNSSQSIQINSSAISSGTGAITTSIVSAGTGTTPAATSAAIIANQTQTTLKTDNLSKLDTGVSVSTISTAGGATSSAAGTCDENDDDDNEKSSVTLKKESMKQLQLQRVKESVASLKKDHQPSSATEIVIEPKSEYDDGNDETVEDLTLDDEEMALEELDQTAGPSHGGEGSSQGYAQWQVDRSQDEVFMAAQEAQQRDPQAKQDKGEQTDMPQEEFELDDCLLESNDIVITQNKDGYVLHVKKLGNITSAKLALSEDEQAVVAAATAAANSAGDHHAQITTVQEVKPHLTTLTTTSHAIKLPSTECELLNIKKVPLSPASSSTPLPTATIIQPTTIHQHHQQQHHHQHQQQHHHHHQLQEHHTTTTNIVTANQQTINTLLGLSRSVHIETKNLGPRIKYSRGNIITTQSGPTATVMTTSVPQESEHKSIEEKHEKYEITEIDLNNQSQASIISDLVKYAEIDDIELPDGTKIGFGLAPQEVVEGQIETIQATQIGSEHHHQQQQHHHQQQQQQQQQQHHQHHHHQQPELQHHQQQQHHHMQEDEEEQPEDEEEEHDQKQQPEPVSEIVVGDGSVTLQHPTITKSYTILKSRPITQDLSSTTTYELSLSDSSMGQSEGDNEGKLYVCRHCGKKYRWKSTLRRHENVECGGKEPCHPCPYCTYKAKQRGNLGVHVRKHHPEKPQLESKRGSKK